MAHISKINAVESGSQIKIGPGVATNEHRGLTTTTVLGRRDG